MTAETIHTPTTRFISRRLAAWLLPFAFGGAVGFVVATANGSANVASIVSACSNALQAAQPSAK